MQGREAPKIASADPGVVVEPHWVWPLFQAEPVATLLPATILRGGNPIAEYRESIVGGAVVLWTGSMAEPDEEGSVDAEGAWDSSEFSADPRTWGPAGRAALEQAVARLAPVAREAGVEVWLRAHCRHVLSDHQACLQFARWLQSAGVPSEGPGAVRLLLDTGGIFTRAMLPRAEEHLQRLASGLELWSQEGLRERLAGVFVNNVRFTAAPSPASVGWSAEEAGELPDFGPPGWLGPRLGGELPAEGLAVVARAVLERAPWAWLIHS